jgi:linoleate 10R-lipoxygenase
MLIECKRASLVIHDLFQTNHRDYNISMTSSYLDLSTLYGDTQEDQDQIRTFKDGKLKPDCYSEERVLGMPPGCGIFLIMFNRYHNWIVEQLAAINENGRFNKPKEGLAEEQAKAAWKKYDNDLFQTGRLITCGLYMNITLGDYLRTIVNLNRSNTTWTLDPRVAMGKKVMGEPSTPRGGGNQVSAEFNLVYRWHSSISKKDEAWTEALYKRLFGKHAAEVSLPELMQGLGKWSASLPKDPYERDYHGLKRGADGRFNDDELVNILCDSIEDVSGASGPNNVPKALRAVEILGMQQARHWECASLNEFRKFFGLKPHETFEHINPDPEVANQLRHLYEHPDFVELYPGIIAEDAKKPMVPGVGCAPTYTVSRAILSDAVTLVRSDRFYTTDYHPKNLTNFGYTAVQYDLGVEQGCVFYKLFLRAFPHHFQQNSIYAHYPMTVPSENRKIMQTLGREAHYNYDRPGFIPLRINLTSYIGAKYMLERPQEFNVTWGAATGFVMGKGGFDFMLSGDTPFHAQQKQIMSKALYKNRWQIAVKTFYEHITLQLLHDYSAKVAGVNQVDITRDVGNLAHVHFASSIFSLPLKTKANPRGIYTEHELWMVMSVVFMAIFFDFDPAVSFPLRQAAYSVGHGLGKVIEAKVKAMNMTSWVSSVVDGYLENHDELKDYGVHMVRKLLESGLGPYEAAWYVVLYNKLTSADRCRSQILPVAVAMVPNQSQYFSLFHFERW